jgi:hypothetical protein
VSVLHQYFFFFTSVDGWGSRTGITQIRLMPRSLMALVLNRIINVLIRFREAGGRNALVRDVVCRRHYGYVYETMEFQTSNFYLVSTRTLFAPVVPVLYIHTNRHAHQNKPVCTLWHHSHRRLRLRSRSSLMTLQGRGGMRGETGLHAGDDRIGLR